MRSVLSVLLLSGLFCFGQAPSGKLSSTLAALRDGGLDRSVVSRQLADEMISLADVKVSRPTVERFAEELTGALVGKPMTQVQLTSLQNSITEVMRGSVTNANSSRHLREVLDSIRIDAMRTKVITKSFLAVGEEIRGPDDTPVLPASEGK
jgi:hypothetical protein